MKVERELHMSRGDGETSYANNSRLQEKSILKTRPVLQQAVAAAHALLSPTAGGTSTMVVADLGCSSGPNTFLFVSEVLAAIVADQRDELLDDDRAPVQVQFFLNDLPGNDFNLVFQSLEKLAAAQKGESLPTYFVAGLPGSFYTRLFPDHSVHLFHSSYCLHWRSKVPEELSRSRIALNEGNIQIWETTPHSVVKMYRKQFEDDFSLFLRLRYNELVSGGQMMLTFLGRKTKDVLRGELSCMWSLLAQALQSLVEQGRVEKEKLDTFNLPVYEPSVDEVKEVISRSELFDVNHIDLFEWNWDPYDDLDGDVVVDSARSGVNVAKCIRAVVEPLIMHHFGEHIIQDAFEIFAQNVAKHLQKVKTRYPVIVLSLKARRAPMSYETIDNSRRYSVSTDRQLI